MHLVTCLARFEKRLDHPAHEHKKRFHKLLDVYLSSKRSSKESSSQSQASAASSQTAIQQFFSPVRRSTSDLAITKSDVNDALAAFIIDSELPFSITERQSFEYLLERVQQYLSAKGTHYRPPSCHALEKNVVAVCQRTTKSFLNSGILLSLQRFGGGLAIDGRKDVLGRSNEVGFLVCNEGCMLIQTQHVPGTKDADTLALVSKQMLVAASKIALDPHQPTSYLPLGKYVFYVVSDSAGAAALSRKKLQLSLGLLSIPCLAHLLSLLPKHLVSKSTGVDLIRENVLRFETITKVCTCLLIRN